MHWFKLCYSDTIRQLSIKFNGYGVNLSASYLVSSTCELHMIYAAELKQKNEVEWVTPGLQRMCQGKAIWYGDYNLLIKLPCAKL